jgi:hypothetical protein
MAFGAGLVAEPRHDQHNDIDVVEEGGRDADYRIMRFRKAEAKDYKLTLNLMPVTRIFVRITARPSRCFNASGARRLANRRADQLGAATAARIDRIFKLGGGWTFGAVDHSACANRARHHQRR